jgi:hypothetical protein
MSDIRKLLDVIKTAEQINESDCGTSTAGGVASVSMPIGGVQKRIEEEKTDESVPAYVKAGMNTAGKGWANWAGTKPGMPDKDSLVADPRKKSKSKVKEAASLKQKLKTTARKLNPFASDDIFARGVEQHFKGQEQSNRGEYDKGGKKNMRQGMRLMNLGLGDNNKQIKVFKDKSGKPIGEIGVDLYASPGNGQWYVKHYATGYGTVGLDNSREARDKLLYVNKHPEEVSRNLDEARLSEEDVITQPGKKRSGDVVRNKGDKTLNISVKLSPADIKELEALKDSHPVIATLVKQARQKSGDRVLESMSDIDIERQDYESMTPRQFYSAYGITKKEWAAKNKRLLKPALPGYKALADLPAHPTIHENKAKKK